MKNMKILKFMFSKIERHDTHQIYYPFLWIEVINNDLKDLFL